MCFFAVNACLLINTDGNGAGTCLRNGTPTPCNCVGGRHKKLSLPSACGHQLVTPSTLSFAVCKNKLTRDIRSPPRGDLYVQHAEVRAEDPPVVPHLFKGTGTMAGPAPGDGTNLVNYHWIDPTTEHNIRHDGKLVTSTPFRDCARARVGKWRGGGWKRSWCAASSHFAQ